MRSPCRRRGSRVVSSRAKGAVARASWFSVAALVVGAVIAPGAGGLGYRHQLTVANGAAARSTIEAVLATDPEDGIRRRVR
jgi:hypothetical protein